MPWDKSDVDMHKKGLSDAQKTQWVKVANAALSKCEDDGGDDCEATAIKAANSTVDDAVSEIREMGATSFADLAARRDAETMVQNLHTLVYDYQELVWNVVYSDDIMDKPVALSALTAEFVNLLAAAAQEVEEDEEEDVDSSTSEAQQQLTETACWDENAFFIPTRRNHAAT